MALEAEALCWAEPAIRFSIDSESKEDLKFVQTGWKMEVHSSHETRLKFKTADGKYSGTFLTCRMTF